MLRELKGRLRSGQADLISVVLLVGISLVVGISVAALFTSQAVTVSGQEDISDVISDEASREFITSVYHNYVLADPEDPEAGFNHTFIFKLIYLSRGSRNYFLVLPLITEGNPPHIYVFRDQSRDLWRSMNAYYLQPIYGSITYDSEPLPIMNVSGDDVILEGWMDLKALGNIPIFRVNTLNTTPYPTAYIMLEFTAPPEWSGYDLTLYSLVDVSGRYYSVERVTIPLGGG